MDPSSTFISNLKQILSEFLVLVPLEHKQRAGSLFMQRRPIAELLMLVPLHQQQRSAQLLSSVTNYFLHNSPIPKMNNTTGVANLEGKSVVGLSTAVVKELSKIVGLDAIKLQIKEWVEGMLLDDNRLALGLRIARRRPPHMAFLGNSGTGKASVARTLGKLFHLVGILKTNKVIEVQIADLIGAYMNQTAQKTIAKIQEAEGGILFVHEGYHLEATKNIYYDLGKNEALNVIKSAMDSGKVLVIFAGNTGAGSMEHAIFSNEGLARKLTNFFHFDDYTCQDLAKILHVKLSNADENSPFYGFKLHASCSVETIAAIIENGTTEKQRKEMNGGLVYQILVKARESLDSRVGLQCRDTESLLTITSEDLGAALCSLKYKGKRKRSEEDSSEEGSKKRKSSEEDSSGDACTGSKVDEPETVEAKTKMDEPETVEAKMDVKAKMDALEAELSKIVGMDALKLQLGKWLKGMIVDEKCEAVGLDVGNRRLPHMVFLGNPGTGKTMVARILAKLLHMVGIIPTENVTEVQRTDLVAKYIGQTGPKTRKMIDKAKGGILFVDEAYRLVVESCDIDFGLEALEEIMSSMDSGDIVVIFAGYAEAMKRVISSNAGFKRRVSKVFHFDDYSCQDLAKIAHVKMSHQTKSSPFYGFKLHPECSLEAIATLIERETKQDERKELNAGLVDQMLVNARENFDSRIDVEAIDAHLARTITLEDLAVAIKDKGKEWLKDATSPTPPFSLYI